MPDLPPTLYVQDSADKRIGLVVNRTPQGTLEQRMRNAGEVVGVYELKRLVKISVTTPQPEVTLTDVPPAAAGPAPVVDTPVAANQQ